jgi:hypothetical protein
MLLLLPNCSPEIFSTRAQADIAQFNAADGRFPVNVTTEEAATSPIILLLNWKHPAP